MDQMMPQLMRQMMRDPFALWRETTFAEPFAMSRWFGDFSPAAFQPQVDVVDEGKTLRVTAELPGMDAKDVTLSISDGALTIKGEKHTDKTTQEEGCYRTERAYGMFQRVIPLPSDVKDEGVEATFDKGVLTVRVPKPPTSEKKVKEIPVSST
jgi:HSP20 family protein